MRFIRITLRGDYLFNDTINGTAQGVKISGVYTKEEARQKAKEAFKELKEKVANGSAEIKSDGRLVLRSV